MTLTRRPSSGDRFNGEGVPPVNDVTNTAQISLNAPLRGASFGQAFVRFWKKYVTFHGRASRSEFWWWFLANAIIGGVLSAISSIFGSPIVIDNGVPVVTYGVAHLPYTVWGLATFIPWLALSWRRLHDTDRSGAWWFIGIVPIVGWIILLVFFLLPPNPAGARFDR